MFVRENEFINLRLYVDFFDARIFLKLVHLYFIIKMPYVADYSVMIDDKWILTAYDPKNRRLETELKTDKISKGKRHTIVISVTDGRGNNNTLKSSFIS